MEGHQVETRAEGGVCWELPWCACIHVRHKCTQKLYEKTTAEENHRSSADGCLGKSELRRKRTPKELGGNTPDFSISRDPVVVYSNGIATHLTPFTGTQVAQHRQILG
jgi:hypothetical protein